MMMEDSLVVPPGTVFVSYEEVKQNMGPKKVLKVFLVDKEGKKHLAATGEDLGDAHYHYRSTKPFSKYGNIDCHNRKELTIWLEMVIAESGGREGPHLDADEQNPEGVYFTSHKNERAHLPDGRRCNRWYLIDQHGNAHLAVIGMERDTKDGHYAYSAEEPFASLAPLACSNQAGVYKWLEKMITHHAAGVDGLGQPTMSAAALSGASGSGMSEQHGGGRKPPLVISLSAIRQARKSAVALSMISAVVVDGGPYRAKPKTKQVIAAAPAAAMPKHKSLGIVQQNQIKKARKLQDDIRAEEERLVTAHLTRLRRSAAAELQGDTQAKVVTMGWLQGNLSEEELEHLEHWTGLLTAVLDMQQQQQQQEQEKQEEADGGGGGGSQAAAVAVTAAAAAGGDEELMKWLRHPDNRQHHLRVVLECLKELGAADLPAKALLGHKVIALVQRCLSQHPHEAVKSLAQHLLQRWQWQMAGHMQVLTNPVYMDDHLAALEDEIACGLVPLPQLPKHKQMLLNTPLPALPKAPGERGYYTPAAPSASHHQLLQQHPGSAPPAMDPAAAAAAGYTGYPGLPSSTGYPSALGMNGGSHLGSLKPGGTAAFGGLSGHPGTPGFYTPMPPSGLHRAGSPLSAAAMAAGGGSVGQPGVLFNPAGGIGQQMYAGYPEAAAAYAGGGASGFPSWGMTSGSAAAPTGSGGMGGAISGSSSDLAALANDVSSLQQQQQQQQLALMALLHQQQQQQRRLSAGGPGSLTVVQQAGAPVPGQQHFSGGLPVSAAQTGMAPQQLLLQQQQHWPQLQQQQQPQQQQHQMLGWQQQPPAQQQQQQQMFWPPGQVSADVAQQQYQQQTGGS